MLDDRHVSLSDRIRIGEFLFNLKQWACVFCFAMRPASGCGECAFSRGLYHGQQLDMSTNASLTWITYVDHVCLLFANFLLFGECSNQMKRHVRVQAACSVNDNAD
jgi:hypothetical protein